MRLQDFKFNATNIKGKNYIEVSERIKAFRECEEFQNWSLETEIINITDSTVLFKAIVKNPEGRIMSTGYAKEDRDASQVNSSSYVENCETSAIGRCLGSLGIGVDGSIASADEVQSAIRYQERNIQQPTRIAQSQQYNKPKKLTDKQANYLRSHGYTGSLDISVEEAKSIIGQLMNGGRC